MKLKPENAQSEMWRLMRKSGYRFQLLCFHEWIPDYFSDLIEHCKHCEQVRKKQKPENE